MNWEYPGSGRVCSEAQLGRLLQRESEITCFEVLSRDHYGAV